MRALVTGGTGFIGSRLIKKLLNERPDLECIYILVRPQSVSKAKTLFLTELKEPSTRHRIRFIEGDLTQANLGVNASDESQLIHQVDHFFHLGAIYDLTADSASQRAVNVEGTRNATVFARKISVGTFHFMSSIAACGFYPGIAREDLFTKPIGIDHPYFTTKYEAESIVRYESNLVFRIYRPAFVVGDARTGVTDKVDGPYYLFQFLKKLRHVIPEWVPLLGLEGGYFNLVPVNYVVDAISFLAFYSGEDGQTFHLTDTKHWRFGELVNLLSRSAHAPQFEISVNARLLESLPILVRKGLFTIPGVSGIADEVIHSLGIPKELFQFINWPTRYDNRHTQLLLDTAGIKVPALETYVDRLWDYWERHLDPDLWTNVTLEHLVNDRVVLITGGSSGIGKATAMRFATAGARVIICARDPVKLESTKLEIESEGGQVTTFVADVTREEDVIQLIDMIDHEFLGLDILVNNAGHSIRRSVLDSLDRLHDFERTMNVNYLAAVSMTLKCIPLMLRRQGGHVINISSIGVLSNSPRFSAYIGSKAGLEAFGRCAAAELMEQNIRFTNINMPLVRTPMIAPTALYNDVPALSPEQAADLVALAIVNHPEKISTRLGKLAEVVYLISPAVQKRIMNTAYRLFSDQSHETTQTQSSPAQQLFATVMKGVHW